MALCSETCKKEKITNVTDAVAIVGASGVHIGARWVVSNLLWHAHKEGLFGEPQEGDCQEAHIKLLLKKSIEAIDHKKKTKPKKKKVTTKKTTMTTMTKIKKEHDFVDHEKVSLRGTVESSTKDMVTVRLEDGTAASFSYKSLEHGWMQALPCLFFTMSKARVSLQCVALPL